jgi:hypothetical protein
LFNYSTPLLPDNSELAFKERDSFVERASCAIKSCEYIKEYKVKGRIPPNLYEYKCLFHSILLLPCLFLEAKGIYCYKKFSFDIIRSEFKACDLEIIDKLTTIRNRWKIKRLLPDILAGALSHINPFLYHLLNKYTQARLPKDLKNILSNDELISGAYKFGEATHDKLKNYYNE